MNTEILGVIPLSKGTYGGNGGTNAVIQ